MSFDRIDLAWAAGLFDGEGSISVHRNPGSKLAYPDLTLAMTDEDVVRHFHAVLGGIGKLSLRPVRPGSNLPLWVWRSSSFEVGQAAIAMLWPYLGQRRRARAVEVLRITRDSQIYRKTERRGAECSEPACTKPVLARGLCISHYNIARYEKRRDTPCIVDGCARRPNGSGGMCRVHTDERRKEKVR